MEEDAVESQLHSIIGTDEVVQVLTEMKTGKFPGPSII